MKATNFSNRPLPASRSPRHNTSLEHRILHNHEPPPVTLLPQEIEVRVPATIYTPDMKERAQRVLPTVAPLHKTVPLGEQKFKITRHYSRKPKKAKPQ